MKSSTKCDLRNSVIPQRIEYDIPTFLRKKMKQTDR